MIPGADTLLDAGEVAIFGGGGEAGADKIEVNISHAGSGGSIIEQGLGFEA